MRIKTVLVVSLAAALAAGGWARAGDAEAERMKRLEAILAEAVDHFELGRFANAKAALDRLVAESFDDREAARLRDAFGEIILEREAPADSGR